MIYKIKRIPTKKLVTVIFRDGGRPYDYLWNHAEDIAPGEFVSIYTPYGKSHTVEVIDVKNYCRRDPKIKYKPAYPVQ